MCVWSVQGVESMKNEIDVGDDGSYRAPPHLRKRSDFSSKGADGDTRVFDANEWVKPVSPLTCSVITHLHLECMLRIYVVNISNDKSDFLVFCDAGRIWVSFSTRIQSITSSGRTLRTIMSFLTVRKSSVFIFLDTVLYNTSPTLCTCVVPIKGSRWHQILSLHCIIHLNSLEMVFNQTIHRALCDICLHPTHWKTLTPFLPLCFLQDSLILRWNMMRVTMRSSEHPELWLTLSLDS